MSTFTVSATRIRAIEPIENADAIELAVIGDYRSVVRKGEYKVGDIAIYIPEAAIVPDWLLEEMNLVGKLAGSGKNRVKAIKLRGCLSQGILYPVKVELGPDFDYYIVVNNRIVEVSEGQDLQTQLGITKYEPAIPAYMSGEVYNAGTHLTVSYDIENFKKFPDVLVDGEDVVMTEKIHGTFCGIGILPEEDWNDKHVRGKFVVFSKGLGAQGLCFQDNERNRGNVYFRALEASGIFDKLEGAGSVPAPLFILGEVYGQGVQDLAYGSKEIAFRAFDLVVGYRNHQHYVPATTACNWYNAFEIEAVPELYRGPFSKEVMLQHTNGMETVSGNSTNIREGIVVKSAVERIHPELGRVILKSVSEAYLLRKGNVTEFQ